MEKAGAEQEKYLAALSDNQVRDELKVAEEEVKNTEWQNPGGAPSYISKPQVKEHSQRSSAPQGRSFNSCFQLKPEINCDKNLKNHELKEAGHIVSSETDESRPIKIILKKSGAVKSFSKESIAHNQVQNNIKMFTISDEKIDCYQRGIIFNSLNSEEKTKFKVLEKAVAEHGYKYQPIDLAQYLIVSHLEIPESLRRMKKWGEKKTEWKVDDVPVSRGIQYLKDYPLWISIGGYDKEGRRIYVIHFGNIIPSDITNNFATYVKSMNLLWDALTISVPEVKDGLCVICDFQDFGVSNWSLTVLRRFLELTVEKYPVRIRRIYFLDQPTYFFIISKIVMTCLPKKFKERLKLISREELKEIIPESSLPPRVGGTSKVMSDLFSWIVKRLESRRGSSWVAHYDK